ncbi:MAG: hypothetical protein KUL77_01830 [Thermomonas sp.]|uniref:hypothetical protein n=1 Tax=Thermomonas sp. TaxID=1971895 RepID=UPI001ECF8F7E|nr:hypothetical protein [Thermomonas sp.]MBV2208286.1 hypothetical protein [Thermomonas sp.]
MNTHPTEQASAAFDAALRTHHQASLQQLSPRTQAQLAQRRHAALRGQTHRVKPAHRLRFAAAGIAAAAALALGLQFHSSEVTPASPAVVSPTFANAPPQQHAVPRSASKPMLEEDPDFYAWLNSPDVQQLAME